MLNHCEASNWLQRTLHHSCIHVFHLCLSKMSYNIARQYSFSSAQRRHEGRKRQIFCLKSYEKSKNKIKFLQFSPFLAITDMNRISSHDLEIEMYISALRCLDQLATPCISFYNAFCLILIGKKKKKKGLLCDFSWLCIAVVPVRGAAACPGFASCALLNLASHLVSSGTVPFSQMDLKRVQATRRFPWFQIARSGQVLNMFAIL